MARIEFVVPRLGSLCDKLKRRVAIRTLNAGDSIRRQQRFFCHSNPSRQGLAGFDRHLLDYGRAL